MIARKNCRIAASAFDARNVENRDRLVFCGAPPAVRLDRDDRREAGHTRNQEAGFGNHLWRIERRAAASTAGSAAAATGRAATAAAGRAATAATGRAAAAGSATSAATGRAAASTTGRATATT